MSKRKKLKISTLATILSVILTNSIFSNYYMKLPGFSEKPIESPSSDYLYYDGSDLYFSNDQSMAATFVIRLYGTDSGSGRKNATGEDEFGGSCGVPDGWVWDEEKQEYIPPSGGN